MRPTLTNYFLEIAYIVSTRSTCLRRHVGAVAVRDKRILATGYNGAPAGARHCNDTGCLREQLRVRSGENHELCRALHAEQNVIVQAAVHGISLVGCDLYLTTAPCVICAKMIANTGMRRVIFTGFYPDDQAIITLGESEVEQVQVDVERHLTCK